MVYHKGPKGKPFGENIVYYCKDCAKIVEARQLGRKYVFICPVCKTKNVAFGTEQSIGNFFHLEDDKPKKKKKEEKEEAEVEK